ncbi:hypothetical protein BC827DRAFT_646556 [Russula dissimulans]|nr:hypothetical protein BC827DRAFT_646556 [Russula dissimulans]
MPDVNDEAEMQFMQTQETLIRVGRYEGAAHVPNDSSSRSIRIVSGTGSFEKGVIAQVWDSDSGPNTDSSLPSPSRIHVHRNASFIALSHPLAVSNAFSPSNPTAHRRPIPPLEAPSDSLLSERQIAALPNLSPTHVSNLTVLFSYASFSFLWFH